MGFDNIAQVATYLGNVAEREMGPRLNQLPLVADCQIHRARYLAHCSMFLAQSAPDLLMISPIHRSP